MKRIPALVAVLAVAVAACGGSADADDGVATLDDTTQLDGAGVTTAAPEVSREEALLAFAACLREAGVDIDDPTVDADGNLRIARPNNPESESDLDREAFRAAREGCQQHLEGVTLGFRDGDRTEIEDQLLEFAACIRDNGYDMPDPDSGGSGTPGQGGGPFGAIDRDDPAFQAAAEACEDTLPGVGPGGGAGRFGGGRDN